MTNSVLNLSVSLALSILKLFLSLILSILKRGIKLRSLPAGKPLVKGIIHINYYWSYQILSYKYIEYSTLILNLVRVFKPVIKKIGMVWLNKWDANIIDSTILKITEILIIHFYLKQKQHSKFIYLTRFVLSYFT